MRKVELHDLYFSSTVVKTNAMDWECNTNVGREHCIEFIGVKARRKEPLGRTKRGLVDNIKMELREMCCEMGWIKLAQAVTGVRLL